MKTIFISISTLLFFGSTTGQTLNFNEAPLNPKPLEELKFKVPSELQGDVAHYAGRYYDTNRDLLLEDGSSFMTYAQWTKEEAYEAKSVFMKFDKNNRITELVKYTSSPITYLYEYDTNGNLVKQQFEKDITTYTYDKKGRLETEFRTFNTTDRTVTIKFTYKKEGDLLKIVKTSTYPDGSETEELHYKNGRRIYEKSVTGVESVCVPDLYGNCVTKKFLKDNRVDKVYYNVVYSDQLTAENIVVRDIRKNAFETSKPQVEIAGSILKLPINRLKEEVIVYLPKTQQYLIAKDFYNDKVEKNNPVSVQVLQSNSPYLGIWYNETFPVFLKNGSTETMIKYGDEDYIFYYDKEEEKYFYFSKEMKGTATSLITYEKVDAPLVMYMNKNATTTTTLVTGTKQLFSYGWTSKALNDTEVVLFYENKPTYIIPIVTKPEPLKIYTGRNYKGEKIE